MRRILLLLFSCILTTAVFAQQDFSADVVRVKADNKTMPQGKMYVTKDKMRFESHEESGGHQGMFIMDFAKQTSAVLMPERKMYVEFTPEQNPAKQRTWAFFRATDVDDACTSWHKMATENWGSCKKLGSETVNGRNTIKYEGTDKQGKVNTVWLDPKIAFPIKWKDNQDNDGGELQNIKEGSQPSSLFEIPSDYQKMQMPMMPNMPQRH